MDERQFRIVAALLGSIVLVGLVLLVVLLFGNGDDTAGGTTTTTGGETTTTGGETTTTGGETTTTGGETTTTGGETTTTGGETTTTVEPTTTTTTIPPLVLQADGLGGIGFGASPDEATGYVTSLLGPSTDDSGWIDALASPYGVCPPPEVRGVHWGSLVLLFTNAETDFAPGGTEHLFSYYYTDNVDPAAGLGTEEDIFIGSTRADLDAAYGDRLEVFEELFGSVPWAVDRDPASQAGLYGYLSGPTTTDLVEAINGGVGCGE
jgi:hypothetical protein